MLSSNICYSVKSREIELKRTEGAYFKKLIQGICILHKLFTLRGDSVLTVVFIT